MDWFDPSNDVVLLPGVERARFWARRYGIEYIAVARQAIYANNGHGKLFEAVCQALDERATRVCDQRGQGYCQYDVPAACQVTVYRAPEPAPYAAADLEFLISAGTQQILFVNGAGSLRPDVPVGSVVLPGEAIREEGTSFHYVPSGTTLRTDAGLNERLCGLAEALGVRLVHGKHWTTDAIYRETWAKVERYRAQGICSVDMELSALLGVAHYRQCQLSALLVVTDMVARPHTWDGTASSRFAAGVRQAAQIAARLFL